MTTTSRFQTNKLPAVMTDGDWTADATLSLTGSGQDAEFSYTLTIYKGAGGQYYVYGTRTSSQGRQTKYTGYYASDATTIGTMVGNAVTDLSVDASLNAAQRLLAAATGAAVSGSA